MAYLLFGLSLAAAVALLVIGISRHLSPVAR